MELKQIKELMTAMGRTGTKRLIIKKDDFELQLEREENSSFKSQDVGSEQIEDYPFRHELTNRTNLAFAKGKDLASNLANETSEKNDETSHYITSPMVGTFYGSPSPEDPSFVKVGDKIEEKKVVCIIEAMKVMNEIKSTKTGTVAEILVESGQPVEFGTKLFRIT